MGNLMKDNSSHYSISERRNILKIIAAGATLAVPGWVLGKNSIWTPEDLPLTPQQTEGPFYPETAIEKQLFNDNDLSRKLGDHEFAKGQQCVIEGVIQDRKGKPIKGSVVEIWQACSSGRYKHSLDDRNPGLLDNNFQFWGRAITGKDGKYSFTTIVPGKYPGRTARHIHYRVDADGFRRCSTQSYFSDFGEDNMRDGIYRSLDRKERGLVTVEFDKPTGTSQKQGSEKKSATNGQRKKASNPWRGTFNVVLASK